VFGATANRLGRYATVAKFLMEHIEEYLDSYMSRGLFSSHVVADRYGHLYLSDTELVQDAFDAVITTGVVASNTPSVEPEADEMQTGA
jgi:hypothetical protein